MEIDTIYNGDCLEILPLMNEKSVDIVVTSPPYNKMEGKNAGKLVEAQTVLEKWLKDFGKDAVKAMKKVA